MIESARQAILNRIDAALGSPRADAAGQWERLPRPYIRTDSLPAEGIRALFEHRLADYGANIFKSGLQDLPQTIEKILSDRDAKPMIIPSGISPDWLPAGNRFVQDTNLSFEKLDSYSGVLTAATVAIAETGSIVLQHGPGEGRRAITLIPDYHLCIVRIEQIVQTVPAAFARLDATKPTTFISGPSATADIEMTRIKGVHGPRFMDVILIE